MATYAINLTESLKNGTSGLTNLTAGDVIETTGYYASGDGGAGTFTVRTKESKTPDNMFTYGLGDNLIAELQIPNGIVNIDQLGANGNACIPDRYYEEVLDAEECNNRSNHTISSTSNASAMDNQGVLNAAFKHPGIQEVRLTAGKIYGIRNRIQMSSNHCLNGCSATIMNLSQNNMKTIACGKENDNETDDDEIRMNIRIENVRLIGNHRFEKSNSESSQGIWIKNGKNIQIRNVQMERFGFGIHITSDISDFYNQVSIDNIQICDALIGIQLNNAENSCVVNSKISTDYTRFDSSKYNHCIYAGGRGKNNILKNLVLKNSNGGYAINRNEAKPNTSPSLNTGWIISNILIDNCTKGIHLGACTHDSIVHNVVGKNIENTGLCLSSAKNVTVSDCEFIISSALPTNTGALFVPTDNNTENYLENVQIRHCYFESDGRVIAIGEGRTQTGDSMLIDSCQFVVRKAKRDQLQVPAFIKGVISRVGFKDCKFEITDFSSTNDVENSHNGVFFYFDSDKNKKMYWSFDHCAFVNSTGISVNSPILSNSGNDSKETVFCSVRNCMIKGFRWIIRIATTKDSEKSNFNPCFDDYNTSERETAASLMDAKKRFLSQNNFHFIVSVEEETQSKVFSTVEAEAYGG